MRQLAALTSATVRCMVGARRDSTFPPPRLLGSSTLHARKSWCFDVPVLDVWQLLVVDPFPVCPPVFSLCRWS